MRIFCSGIGGIGLSAYAAHMRSRGHDVSGSDRSASDITEYLKQKGIAVNTKQDGSAVPATLDLFVYSEAIPASSPERVKATKLGVRQLSYVQAVGELTRGKKLIAICGTHGKSSTTALSAILAVEAGLDPNVIVGTKVRELKGTNVRMSEKDLWIVEACEYRRSFLSLDPSLILITNADGDHFDYFKDEEDYRRAFVEFIRRLPKDGKAIIHGSDPVVASIAKEANVAILDADTFPLITLNTPGKHMRQNAQLVLALASVLGIDGNQARATLSGFAGTWRRMEKKGRTRDGAIVIDDYAHHPVEIRATLAALREKYAERRIVCVFQPHTHDRTLKLWNDFLPAFREADLVLLPDVYDARPDRERESVDMDKLRAAIERGSDVEALYTHSLGETEEKLKREILAPKDVLVVMGAGDVTSLTDRLVMS